jgi:hypothetical protein
MNQPSALSKVLTLREVIATHDGQIGGTEPPEPIDPPTLLRISFILWTAIIAAVLLVIGALL